MGSRSTTKLPELVRDSKLETILDGDNTVHIYCDRPGRHVEPRRETWKKEKIVGSGGNGVVWLETQLTGGLNKGNQARYRAVKQITLAQATSVLQICKSELEALAKFSSPKYMPSFVESFGWYEGSGFLFIAMEYCPLGDLQRFLIEHTQLSESDACEIIFQVVKGLKFMHDEGFAHRDLKPGNILIKSCPPEDEWWVKICDMGLSKRIEGIGAGTTAVKGTPGFFAPEQLGLGDADPRMADPFKTDIWCLGEMSFRMLCGEAAFSSNDDLRRYHQGTAMFPKERLHDIGATGPAISFITSAMLAEPQSRLETNQAFDHKWFEINVTDDHAATNQVMIRISVLNPQEPGAPSHSHCAPRGQEATARPSYGNERQHNEVNSEASLNHPITKHDSNEESAKNSQTLRQMPIFKENGPVIGTDTEHRSHNTRSPRKTNNRYGTSRYNERPSMAYQNRRESDSPKPISTHVAGEPIIHTTGAEDAEEDGNVERPIEAQAEDISEAMQTLTKIEEFFNGHLRPRCSWYLINLSLDIKQRRAEYQWLTQVATCDVLLKADEIDSKGNENIRTRRKVLVDGVNEMLDELELAKELFNRGAESKEDNTTTSYPQSQQWVAYDGYHFKSSRVPIPSLRRKLHKDLLNELPRWRPNNVGREASQSPPLASFDDRGNILSSEESSSEESSSDDNAIYEPPPPPPKANSTIAGYRGTFPLREQFIDNDMISKAPSPYSKIWNWLSESQGKY
ncbi:kinase-like domain-containing protein [Xylaria castorea]|nr:kinase-like domain-containing protein [Xylaria castorea]